MLTLNEFWYLQLIIAVMFETLKKHQEDNNIVWSYGYKLIYARWAI